MRNPAFNKLIDEILELHESKNSDYAQDTDPLSNLRRSTRLGIPAWKGVIVRLTDKWSRVEQLTAGKLPKHESLRDSLIDNAVYSLLAVILLDEEGSTSASSDGPLRSSVSWPATPTKSPTATKGACSSLEPPSVRCGG